MKVDAYATRTTGTYLIVPHATPVSPELDAAHGPMKLFKSFELTEQTRRIALDSASVLDDIRRQGWAVAQMEVRTSSRASD